MIKLLKQLFWKLFTEIDSILKFPNLKNGEIGIQVGFDMKYAGTSDLFAMYKRVKPNGLVIGIDPDPRNISIAQKIIDKANSNIKLIQKAVFSEKGECEFLLGDSTSWNQLNNVPIDSTVDFINKKLVVEMDSLDTIVDELKIDINNIAHINLTINGAENAALQGMENILANVNDLAITAIAGRYDESGTINNRPDYEVIIEQLQKYGFTVQFKRMHQFIWWGFFVKTLFNRKWIYGKKNYGVVLAAKGKKKIKWYQSFS